MDRVISSIGLKIVIALSMCKKASHGTKQDQDLKSTVYDMELSEQNALLFKWRRLVKRLNGLETTERECIKEYKNIYWLKHDPQVTLL